VLKQKRVIIECPKSDASNDLGIKSQGTDTVYNKGRDIEKVYVKNTVDYLTLTIVNKHLFSKTGKLKLFVTLDIDTLENSGRISYPEDSLTKVPKKAACRSGSGDPEFH
jgi:hypothetical protein